MQLIRKCAFEFREHGRCQGIGLSIEQKPNACHVHVHALVHVLVHVHVQLDAVALPCADALQCMPTP